MTLNIYTFAPVDGTISSDYRLLTLARTCQHLGLPVQWLVDRNIEGTNIEQRMRNFCEADMILMYQPVGPDPLGNLRMAKSFLPSLRDGSWKYPPTFIADTDDNLFRVDPHNPAFKDLGYCDPDTGKEIPKGQQISEVIDGKRRVLWADGQNGFDVKRNKETLETYRQIINEADAITCTTPRSAAYVTEHARPSIVKVVPNMMRFDDYPQLDLMPNKRPTILWQGGQNHEMDWRPLKDAIRNVVKKHPDCQWITWGVNYPWVTEVIPPERLTFAPWVDWRQYRLRRVMFGEDISLAPLAPTSFNQCRSAIKFYEASMAKRPAATLAQRTGPYADEILDGETGLLFDTPEEFEEKLCFLIENQEERLRLGANAKQWVSDNRDAMKLTPGVIKFYEDLRGEIEYTHPHMPPAAWAKFEGDVRAQAEAAEKAQQEAQKQLQPA